jgi:hypothetical protein
VQKDLGKSTILELNYVGNHGVLLASLRDEVWVL